MNKSMANMLTLNRIENFCTVGASADRSETQNIFYMPLPLTSCVLICFILLPSFLIDMQGPPYRMIALTTRDLSVILGFVTLASIEPHLGNRA